ncbi:kinase-like domain-containing protein [Rhizophagus irregularis DAOM 181602=DAOM 197198]|nr:kinase-like domain-containing protein [Rhizophagus irregularis DAOM 181602=DAOM 197198]
MPNIRYELIYELSGFSEIYTADWIDGYYEEWDFKNQQLVRNGTQEVILKRLDDAESINRTWFEEAINGKQIREIHLSYQNMENELLKPKVYKPNGLETNSTNSRLFSSNIYKFENLPEPKNATEEEQEVFYSKSYGFKIPDNINEFNKSDIQNVDISIKVNSKKLSNKIFEMSQVNLNYDIRDYYKKEAIQQIQQIKRANININDENEIYNNPNLHSKEQNILEIPDELF